MRTIVDVRCDNGHFHKDVWIDTVKPLPLCHQCGATVWRASAPAITPQGTRPEKNTDVARIEKVDTKAIAEATTKEIEEKYARFSDPVVAEENVSREVNEHINDPLPEVPELSFEKGQNLDATVVKPIAA